MSLNFFNPFFSVKVMDGLFISNQTAAKDQQFIINNKFSLIINTCPRQFKILPIPNTYKVTNFHWQNSKGQLIDSINMNLFKSIFEEMTHNLEQGYGTLIVSDRGCSRSITLVLLYLMDKFGWELFKALQYINSKRQNLSVRATYLKLLVNYQKSLKPGHNQDQLTNKKISDDNELANHIKDSKNTEKWSQNTIKSTHQRLISNTFKNTLKKRHINEINEQFRNKINQTFKLQKRSQTTHYGQLSQTPNEQKYKNLKKREKSVQFSNEIEIIVKKSAITNIFPQYNQLSSETDNYNLESKSTQKLKQNHNPRQQKIMEHQNVEPTFHHQNRQMNQVQQTKNREVSYSPGYTGKKETSNSRLINVRKIENMNSKIQNAPSQHILQLDDQDIYHNEFFENEIQKQQQSTISNFQLRKTLSQISSSMENKQSLLLNSSLYNLKNQHSESNLDSVKQRKQQIKIKQSNPQKTRLSSYKKLKATFIQSQLKNSFSPHKKQKILTEPKSETQLQVPNDKQRIADYKRRLSASQNEGMGFFQKQQAYQNKNQQIYLNKKRVSSTMGAKVMNRFEKKSSSSYKQQKRCQTPQIVGSQNLLINNQAISSHNTVFNRPLSRGKSNSVRMANKKNSAQEQKSEKGKNIFNVNINVNIGKLEMFGTKNYQETETKEEIQKEKIFKNHSQLDKMSLVHTRPRSNSSNQNYSKFSFSSLSSNDHRKDLSSQKMEEKNKIYKEKLNKDILRISQNKITPPLSYLLTASDPFYSSDDQNLIAPESFSKQEIIDKINRKLINNSRNSKRSDQPKKSSALQNNFL